VALIIFPADSPEYAKLKEERSQVLWRAVERIIPDIRSRAEVSLQRCVSWTLFTLVAQHFGEYFEEAGQRPAESCMAQLTEESIFIKSTHLQQGRAQPAALYAATVSMRTRCSG
jgi:hypothetical protein